MRKYFITGLILLLPLALTFAIVMFLVNLLTGPFIGGVSGVLEHLGILQEGFFFLSATQVQYYVSQILILLTLFFSTVLLGVLTRWFFVHYLIKLGDYIFHRIPVIRSIYKTSQDVVRTVFGTETRSFKQVVLVPFPNKETHSMGLVTQEGIPHAADEKAPLVAVFVPTTPNPTSGFLMMYDADDLIYLDMSVEDAFKYIISCGVIQTPFKKLAEEALSPDKEKSRD